MKQFGQFMHEQLQAIVDKVNETFERVFNNQKNFDERLKQIEKRLEKQKEE